MRPYCSRAKALAFDVPEVCERHCSGTRGHHKAVVSASVQDFMGEFEKTLLIRLHLISPSHFSCTVWVAEVNRSGLWSPSYIFIPRGIQEFCEDKVSERGKEP